MLKILNSSHRENQHMLMLKKCLNVRISAHAKYVKCDYFKHVQNWIYYTSKFSTCWKYWIHHTQCFFSYTEVERISPLPIFFPMNLFYSLVFRIIHKKICKIRVRCKLGYFDDNFLGKMDKNLIFAWLGSSQNVVQKIDENA